MRAIKTDVLSAVVGLMLAIATVTRAEQSRFVFDSWLGNSVTATSDYSWDNGTWTLFQNATANITISGSDAGISVSGNASAESSVAIGLPHNFPLLQGQNMYTHAEGYGSARWRYTGKPGDSPSVTFTTAMSATGWISTDGYAEFDSNSTIISDGEAYGYAMTSTSVNPSTIEGYADGTQNGLLTSHASLNNGGFYEYLTSPGYLDWEASGNYTISANGSYHTAPGATTITATCDLQCEADAQLQVQGTNIRGHTYAIANINGSSSVTLTQ